MSEQIPEQEKAKSARLPWPGLIVGALIALHFIILQELLGACS